MDSTLRDIKPKNINYLAHVDSARNFELKSAPSDWNCRSPFGTSSVRTIVALKNDVIFELGLRPYFLSQAHFYALTTIKPRKLAI